MFYPVELDHQTLFHPLIIQACLYPGQVIVANCVSQLLTLR